MIFDIGIYIATGVIQGLLGPEYKMSTYLISLKVNIFKRF